MPWLNSRRPTLLWSTIAPSLLSAPLLADRDWPTANRPFRSSPVAQRGNRVRSRRQWGRPDSCLFHRLWNFSSYRSLLFLMEDGSLVTGALPALLCVPSALPLYAVQYSPQMQLIASFGLPAQLLTVRFAPVPSYSLTHRVTATASAPTVLPPSLPPPSLLSLSTAS